MINQRLFYHYNIDTKKNLQIKNICPRPYDTIQIDKNGSCYACECTSWLPQSIGNLQLKSISHIKTDIIADYPLEHSEHRKLTNLDIYSVWQKI